MDKSNNHSKAKISKEVELLIMARDSSNFLSRSISSPSKTMPDSKLNKPGLRNRVHGTSPIKLWEVSIINASTTQALNHLASSPLSPCTIWSIKKNARHPSNSKRQPSSSSSSSSNSASRIATKHRVGVTSPSSPRPRAASKTWVSMQTTKKAKKRAKMKTLRRKASMVQRKVKKMIWVMRSKMSINGHPRIRELRPSIVNQDRTNSIQISRPSQVPKLNISNQLRETSNSTTMPSNTTTIKATRLNTPSNTTQIIMLQHPQQINPITIKPSLTMVRIQTRPVTTTRTKPSIRELTKINHSLKGSHNSKEIQPNSQTILLKTDYTSFWRTCWSTCTMARERRNIVIITLKLSAFSTSRKRSKKWIERILWSISIHCSIYSRQRLKISWVLWGTSSKKMPRRTI